MVRNPYFMYPETAAALLAESRLRVAVLRAERRPPSGALASTERMVSDFLRHPVLGVDRDSAQCDRVDEGA